MLLKDRVAIVTGGTSGIGKATIERFVKEGAKVVFCGRRESQGKAIEKGYQDAGADVTFIKADCTVDADVEHLLSKTIDLYGAIDILVNNAGTGRFYKFEDLDMKTDVDDILSINLRSCFLSSKLAIRQMLKQKKGVIINIASVAGLTGLPNLTSYCASKGGVVQLTKSLAIEFASRNIRVNAICPGFILTESISDNVDDAKGMIAEIPMGRAGQVQEIASAVTFLASDESSFITGISLPVDGGTIIK